MNHFIKDGQVYAMPSQHYDGSTLYELESSEVQAILHPEPLKEELSAQERTWRDAELAVADTELNKVQDGEGTGLVSDWREYRKALRSYPEAPDFPKGERPTFINTDGV